MAPAGEAYFPPLDRCLGGGCRLISWEATYTALSEADESVESELFQRFLKDAQTTELIKSAISPYRSPNAQTRATFDTKTSAINVSPSANARYDIQQIKEDAIWLSKKTDIDEVTALRNTVLEWQTASAENLLRGDPAERSLPAAQTTGSNGNLTKATKSTEQTESPTDCLNEISSRRSHLLKIFLNERCYLLKTCEYIVSYTVCNSYPADHRSAASTGPAQWLGEAGRAIMHAWRTGSSQDGKSNSDTFFSRAIFTLKSKIHALLNGCTWLDNGSPSSSLDAVWINCQVLEIIHILQIILNLLDVLEDPLGANDVLAWFRLMNDTEFFEHVREPTRNLAGLYDLPLQSLAVLVSLKIIDILVALQLLTDGATMNTPAAADDTRLPYILNPPAVGEINEIMISLAPLNIASPVVLAWTIIAQHSRDLTENLREAKETRQSIRAVNSYGAADSSDTDEAERQSSGSSPSLRRRSSASSDTSMQSTVVEEVHDMIIMARADGDPIAYLARNVQDGIFFDVMITIANDYCTSFGFQHHGKPGRMMRNVLLDLISSCVDFIPYQPALVSTTILILAGTQRHWDLIDSESLHDGNDPPSRFIRNKALRHKILLVATSRFPYETIPFTQLCSALAFGYVSSDGSESKPWQNLEELDIFTCRLPLDFHATKPIREDEEGDYIQLTEDLWLSIGSEETDLLSQVQLPIGTPRKMSKHLSASTDIGIPSGTTGVVQSDTKPFVVGWNHTFAGLAYMGKVLQRASTTNSASSSLNDTISADVTGEIIHLITSLVISGMKFPGSHGDPSLSLEYAHSILGQASDGLNRHQDIISIIFEIFEYHLYAPQAKLYGQSSIELLVQCIQFIHVMVLLMPDRVWPFLGRSSLLSIDQDEAQLNYIISQEMALGTYRFLLGYVRVYDALIEDSVAHAASRRAPSTALARFGSKNGLGSGVSQSTMKNVLFHLTKSLLDVLESNLSWKFTTPADRMEINGRVCQSFEKVLNYCYRVNIECNINEKLTSALAPTAEIIISTFLSVQENDSVLKPILECLSSAVQTQGPTLPSVDEASHTFQIFAIAKFVTTLLRAQTLLDMQPSHLECRLFDSVAILARLYVAHERHRMLTIQLLDALLRSAASNDRQPPSLLGHLDHGESKCFLDVLSNVNQALGSAALTKATWAFLCSGLSKRQPWFAMYILTGSTPRETITEKSNQTIAPTISSDCIFSTALDKLSSIEKLPPTVAVSMLSFVAVAADHWPWILTNVERHPRFLSTISEYVSDMGQTLPADFEQSLVSSCIARILAMYTHHMRLAGNQSFAKGLMRHMNYFIKNAIKAPLYNNSLHANLRQNTREKFPACTLNDFKKSALYDAVPGDDFYYDMRMAEKILSYETAWAGQKSQGFAEEFRRANLNYSLVEAQVALFHSWKFLLVELSACLASEPKFPQMAALTIIDCLKANTDNILPQLIFNQLSFSRAQLAFVLSQQLVDVKCADDDVKKILPTIWNTIRAHSTDLEAVLAREDADYHRILLRILYLTLQAHASPLTQAAGETCQAKDAKRSVSTATLQIVLEIISVVVAQGFRSLAILLHTSPQFVRPGDVSLLTAILRSCLQVPELERISSHLLTAFAESQTARYATTLLSWSDQFASSFSGDPVYAELSINFLVVASSQTALAESLATDGVLGQILATNLIRVLQRKAFAPFDAPLRMYMIWSRGILPLLLNLLRAIGPPMTAEIAAALNSFPLQISQASKAFETSRSVGSSNGLINLSVVAEAHDLSLIVGLIKSFCQAGASAAVLTSEVEGIMWDASQVKEDIEGLLLDRGTLRQRISATSSREEVLGHKKSGKRGHTSESMLEDKIVEGLTSVVGILEASMES